MELGFRVWHSQCYGRPSGPVFGFVLQTKHLPANTEKLGMPSFFVLASE